MTAKRMLASLRPKCNDNLCCCQGRVCDSTWCDECVASNRNLDYCNEGAIHGLETSIDCQRGAEGRDGGLIDDRSHLTMVAIARVL